MKLIVKVMNYVFDPLRVLFLIFVLSSIKAFMSDSKDEFLMHFCVAIASSMCFLTGSAIVDAIKESKK